MLNDVVALHTSDTWDLVSVPPNKKIAECHWVAQGYTQIFSLDYENTLSLVVKIASIHIFLSMVAIHHQPIHQLNIKNALLHNDLKEEVYMEHLLGFIAQRRPIWCTD